MTLKNQKMKSLYLLLEHFLYLFLQQLVNHNSLVIRKMLKHTTQLVRDQVSNSQNYILKSRRIGHYKHSLDQVGRYLILGNALLFNQQ